MDTKTRANPDPATHDGIRDLIESVRGRLVTTLLAVFACLVLGPRVATADLADDGIATLVAEQFIDGSWGGEPPSPATIFQSTSESLETLSFQRPQPAYADGLN